MPRQRKEPNAPTKEQLIYLAGIFESTLGLRGVGTNGAVGISNTEPWPKYMAETYGGNHRTFTASRTERTFWGWYVPIKRRLELVQLLQDAKVCVSTDLVAFDQIKQKLEKSINSGHGDEGA